MKALSSLVASFLLGVGLIGGPAVAGQVDYAQTEREVTAFFDEYLSVYNRRFGRPERSDQFRQELSELVQMPFLLSPPARPPSVPDSLASFTAGFEGFVTMLEGKGVTRLVWDRQEFQVLSANKVLANNIGVGLTEDGQVAYETVSFYLLYRTDAGWRIAMFSPYDRDKALRLERL